MELITVALRSAVQSRVEWKRGERMYFMSHEQLAGAHLPPPGCLTATNNKATENGSNYGGRQDENNGAAARRGESGAALYDR